MGLRRLAETDLAGILEDSTTGFGWPITVTDPSELVANLVGFSDDIALSIDPDTGQLVSGRLATAVLRISSFIAKGMALPQGIADSGSKPWLIGFDDINGGSYTFKVKESHPDRALGIVTCILVGYE